MLVTAGLGVLALGLCILGLAGIIAYSLAAQTKEMGIRVALGASKREVLFESMRYWVKTGIAAMGCGMLLALALLPGMKEILYATTPLDPVSFVATTIFLGSTLLSVIFLSARSIVSVDPIEALRVE